MLFLSNREKEQWTRLGNEIVAENLPPTDLSGEIRSNLIPVFRCFAGALLAAKGKRENGKKWFRTGMLEEEDGIFFNKFVASFLERQGGRFVMPAVAFADPRPYVHFSGVPIMKEARNNFMNHCAHSMPEFDRPIRIMDIGCGDGALLVGLLKRLREFGKISDVAGIFLVDSSAAMIELAKETAAKDFPSSIIQASNAKIEEISDKIDAKYDIALSSLAYHHMPIEKKKRCLDNLKRWIDYFVILEVDANNDTPELHTPELALSVYQSYGRLIDFVFAHDAPIEVACACVDLFLMTEVVSIFTQPRGERTEYHMLRSQWHDLFRERLGPEFSCLGDSICYADEYFDMFMICYGRGR